MLYVVLRGMAVSVRESRHTQLASRRTADIFRRYQAQHRGAIRSHSRNRAARDEPLQEKATTEIHPTYSRAKPVSKKNKESRTISLNSQYVVVFKNPRDVSQMTTLAKQMYPGRVKFVQEAFAETTSTHNGYILVDLI